MSRLVGFFDRWKYDLLVLGMYFFTLAYMIKYYDVQSFDIKVHNFLLLDYLQEGYFPSPPGYYTAIFLLDLLIWYKYPLVLSALVILTASFWWKYRISLSMMETNLQIQQPFLFLLTASLLFLSPIYIPSIDGSYWYLGKFTPTIWHNSTLIASFPFCLLLFRQTLRWFASPEKKYLWQILGLSLVIMLIKPSFMFCFIPAFPVFTLIHFAKEKSRWAGAIVTSLVLLLILYLEKRWIFDLDPMIEKMYAPEERSSVIINPLRVHLHYSKEPWFDAITSFPTTLIFLIFWGKNAFKFPFFSFSSILLIFALAVYLIFSETGFRELHGNFYWQIPIALFLHYLSMVIWVGRNFIEKGKKISIPFLLFGLMYLTQVGFGLAYWHRLFVGHALN